MTRKTKISIEASRHLDTRLVRYMNEVYHLKRSNEELNVRLKDKKLSIKQVKEISEEITKNTKRLRQLQGSNYKIKILNEILFPAMANLTFFFWATAEYPELHENFTFDIMDLLGVRRLNPKPHLLGGNYAFMFEDLIAGILRLQSYDEDYRLRLVHMLQELISLKLYGPKILDTLKTTSIVYGDIDRAKAWTEMLALRISDVYKFSIKTNSTYGETEEQRLKAFNKNLHENRPRRTFNFNAKKLIEK